MEARTISVSVRIPKSYRVDLLQQQLTAYAQQLIDAAKPASIGGRTHRGVSEEQVRTVTMGENVYESIPRHHQSEGL